MTVSLAGVPLTAVALMRAAERRHIIHHHLPGYDGDVLQDIGRGPSTFIIEGLLHGEQSQADAEALRGAFRAGQPVELIALLASALQVEQVVIRSLELRERASWPELFDIRAVIVEYVEPPAPVTTQLGGLADVADLSISDQADAWSSQSSIDMTVEGLARKIIGDPASSAGILSEAAAHPKGLMGDVSSDVGGRLSGDIGALSSFMGNALAETPPALFGAIAGALTGDPGALQGALTGVAGSALGPLFGHMANGDLAAGILGAASSLTGGQVGDLLGTLANNAGQLAEIVATLKDDPLGAAALAAGMLADLGTLPDVLASAPDLLANLDPSDIAGSLKENLQDMAGEAVKNVLTSVLDMDPEKAGALIQALADAGSLQEVAEILADQGMDFLETQTGIDIRDAVSTVEALFQAGDFIQKAKNVLVSMRELASALEEFNPLTDLQALHDQQP